MTTKVKIGTGVLTWNRRERVSDRYGSIWLTTSVNSDAPVQLRSVDGYGALIVEILETRKSPHIGDLFRGIFPETPDIGDRFVLGKGEVFYENQDGVVVIGLMPGDGRESDWMNPKKLYRAHDQTVSLYFEKVNRCESTA